ncbi:tetratricopeptide repeat-containing diguanylate cyclase [Deinococcus detaillensis]|uniref:tetratricopeptide repeat-containing diguanylate cyclase n=1 Tax=Deinococcus detaillensis TaxID=2592048 RepID=UPI00163D6E20|nr:GGDEF domain-containing protein [Deinococcus detaillensis]
MEQPLDTAELVRATLYLGYGLMNQGNFNAAEPELRRALHLYVELEDQEGQRDSLNVLGIVKARRGRPVEALELFLQVKHLSVTLENVEDEANALLNIGATYSTMSDHPNALHYHFMALDLSRQHALLSVERRTLNNLSVSYNEIGGYNDALEAALACLNVQAEEDPMLDALVFQNAGYAHFGLKQFPEAETMYLKARLLMETRDQASLAGLDLLLGRAAQQQGNREKARHLFERSLKLCQKIGDEQGQTESLLRLGELLGESGEVEDAQSALHRARTLAEQGQLRDKLCAIDLALSNLCQQAGQYREAFNHIEQHLQLKGELFSAASDQRIQSLRVRFDLEQAERERLTAQHRNAELSELNARLESTNRDLLAAQAQTAELMARLEQHANEDALTGLLNRRAFDAALSELSPAQRVSIVVCDIDHFKSVNDRFSHLIGDEVLRQVAGLLRGQLRRGDLLARYGGEEFVLLLAETSQTDTLAVCEHLRRTIQDYDWSTVCPELSLTVSLGAAVARLEPTTLLQDVIRAADDALYAAKNGGRNRVEVRLIEPSAS